MNVAQELDPAAGVMGKAYQEILHCEAIRRTVFAGTRTPLIFGEPEPWLVQLIEALRLAGEGQQGPANELRQKAFEEAPAITGTLEISKVNAGGEIAGAENVPFEWIADGDSRLGPVLEMIVNGRYYWASPRNISEIVVDPPADLRDLVWAPSHFRWANSGEAVGVIPTRYVASESNEDGAIRLARKTTWQEIGNDMVEGLGQKVFITDSGDYGLLDIRRLVFTSEPAA